MIGQTYKKRLRSAECPKCGRVTLYRLKGLELYFKTFVQCKNCRTSISIREESDTTKDISSIRDVWEDAVLEKAKVTYNQCKRILLFYTLKEIQKSLSSIDLKEPLDDIKPDLEAAKSKLEFVENSRRSELVVTAIQIEEENLEKDPRITVSKKQSDEMPINVEVLLAAKYPRNERKNCIPRIAIPE